MSPTDRLPAGARAIVHGDRRALARLITAVENHDPAARPVLQALYRRTGKAHVIGFTGPLGVGKSSLINGILAVLRARGLKVGVIAVDPSSPFSGGSVLGDRVRIERQVGDEGVFVRSMASRGHTGGVAATTREVCRLLDAFGLDVVLVETVGSGQVDVEIREVATTSVVVLVPHLGDEVQSLKAGLFEIADVFCVNKADLAGADLAAKDLSELVSLGANPDGWRPAVVTTSTQTGAGLDVLWGAIEAHEQFLDAKRLRAAGERRRLAREIVGLVRERVGRELTEALDRDPDLNRLLDGLVARTTDPYSAADRMYRDARRKG
jgi:GTPase